MLQLNMVMKQTIYPQLNALHLIFWASPLIITDWFGLDANLTNNFTHTLTTGSFKLSLTSVAFDVNSYKGSNVVFLEIEIHAWGVIEGQVLVAIIWILGLII